MPRGWGSVVSVGRWAEEFAAGKRALGNGGPSTSVGTTGGFVGATKEYRRPERVEDLCRRKARYRKRALGNERSLHFGATKDRRPERVEDLMWQKSIATGNGLWTTRVPPLGRDDGGGAVGTTGRSGRRLFADEKRLKISVRTASSTASP